MLPLFRSTRGWARSMNKCLTEHTLMLQSKPPDSVLRLRSPNFLRFYHYATNTTYHRSLFEHNLQSNKCSRNFVRYLTESQCDKSHHSRHQTVDIICNVWTEILETNNIPEARVSVEYITAHVLGRKTMHGIAGDHKLNQQQIEHVNRLCQERLQHKPVQYILGEWSFHDIELKMKPPVFIPRPETEELVERTIQMLKNRHLHTGRLLELCCGSGAITLSLLHRFPKLKGVAVDISPEACNLTQENAQLLGVSDRITVLSGDLTHLPVQETLRDLGPFDVLVSNPPYIPTDHMATLEPHIGLYEDRRALDGGMDGLDVIRHILRLSPQLLKPESDILLETDPGQPKLIQEFVASMEPGTVQYVSSHQDYCDRERFCHLQTMDSQQWKHQR